jgi:serine/threonine-protein kinase
LRDRYELIAELGEGGFGTAFAARDQWVPDTLFVIKLARDVTGAVESLRREYSHLWSLQHPNIVPIQWLDQDTDTGDFFLVIRYGGLSVESIIESYGRFDLEFAISVLSDAALGLHHAHVCGVIHHDVSPGNILIDEKGVARVTDFGVSAMGRYATIATSKRTIIGTGLGFKQSYAAPEMHKGTAVTRKADQYSLALSFCAMLEGKGLSPRYQPRGFGRLSSRQNRALRQALSESADDRFPTIVDFAEALAK